MTRTCSWSDDIKRTEADIATVKTKKDSQQGRYKL